jgi:6-phosphogluconolactonase (cycloisomerase 2 family)
MPSITKSPGTCVSDSSIGTVSWDSPGNVMVHDTSYAMAGGGQDGISHYIKCTNFGFNIPVGNRITGVKVRVDAVGFENIYENSIKLVVNGSVAGHDKAKKTKLWSSTSDYMEYGAEFDLWGNTLTPAIVNSSSFGVAISVKIETTDYGAYAMINHIEIVVYHESGEVKQAVYTVYNGSGTDEVRYRTDAELTILNDVNGKFDSTNVEGALEECVDMIDEVKRDYVRQPAYARTSGTSTAYTVTLDPAPEAIVEGFGITIRPHIDCGANPTLNINNLGAIALKKNDGTAFAAGELVANSIYTFRRVGMDFFADSSGEGLSIVSQSEELCKLSGAINRGETVGITIRYKSLISIGTNVIPTGTGRGCDFSTDGTYLAVANMTSPYITIYKREGDTFNKLSNPSTLPTGTGYGCAFSPDGTYLAVAHDTSPYITIYKREGDTFNKLSNPSTLPTGIGYGCSFSHDGNYLAVSHSLYPYITIYKREGDTFNKLSNPSTLPTGTGYGCAFSHDGTYLAVAHSTSPYITIYKREGNTFNKLSDPSTLPTGTGRECDFSPDGTYLAVAHITSPYITIYKREGNTFNKLSNPSTLPPGTGYGCAFSPDGTYLAVAHSTSPYITIYKREGDTFNKLSDPSTLPTGIGYGCSFSLDGNYLAVANSNFPYISIYTNLIDYSIAERVNTLILTNKYDWIGIMKQSGSNQDIKPVLILIN